MDKVDVKPACVDPLVPKHKIKFNEPVPTHALLNARHDGNYNFPDLSKHNNWMAKCLTKEKYRKLFSLKTPNGVTIDDIIQTGVDNPGHPFIYTVGCVAGDEVLQFKFLLLCFFDFQ